MKIINQRKILILILLLPLLLLSGCEDVDEALVEIAFEAWAEENNLVENGNWQPEGMVINAVEDTLGEITNREPNVQLNGVDIIRDIEKADKLADQALKNFDTAAMASALSIRPHDWTLQEKDAAVWLANGNGAAAQSAFDKSDQLLLDSIGSGGSCKTMRINQLRTRADSLQKAGMHCVDNVGCPDKGATVIREQHENTMTMIEDIYVTGHAPICD